MQDPSPLYETIGAAVREARHRADLSQDDLANSVSLTRTSITNLERGRQQVPLHTLYDIAEAVGCAVKELLPDTSPISAPLYGDEDVERWATQLARPSHQDSQ